MKALLFLFFNFIFLSSAQAITYSASNGAICVNTNNSRLQCWGDKSNDKFRGYEEVANKKVIKFNLIDNFGCALLKTERKLKCWGNKNGLVFKFYNQLKNLSIKDYSISSYQKEVCVTPVNGDEICHKDHPKNKYRSFKKVSGYSDYKCGITFVDKIECWGEAYNDNDHGFKATEGHKFKDVSVHGRYSCGTLFDDSNICWGSIFKDELPSSQLKIKKIDGHFSGFTCILYINNTINCLSKPLESPLLKETSSLLRLKVIDFDISYNFLCVRTVDKKTFCRGSGAKHFIPFNGKENKHLVIHSDFACIITINDQLDCRYDFNKMALYKNGIGKKVEKISTGLKSSYCYKDENKLIHCILPKNTQLEKDYKKLLYQKKIKAHDYIGSAFCFITDEKSLLNCLAANSEKIAPYKNFIGTTGSKITVYYDYICKTQLNSKNRVCSNFPEKLLHSTKEFKLIHSTTVNKISRGCALFKENNDQLYCWGPLSLNAPLNLIFETFGEPLNLNIENNPYSPIRSLGLQIKKSKDRLNNFHNNFYGGFLYSYINKLIYSNYSNKFKESVLVDYQKLADSYGNNKKVNSDLNFYGITFSGDTILSLPPTYAVKKEITAIINNILHSTRKIFDDSELNELIDPVLKVYPDYKKDPNFIRYKGLVAHYGNLNPVIQKLISNHKTMGLGQVLSELVAYTYYY